MEMPRCCSISIQSERVERVPALPRTAPADWMAPAAASRRSVKVVLPASGCEMIAKVRRVRNGSAIGRGADSAAVDRVIGTAGLLGRGKNRRVTYWALYRGWQVWGQIWVFSTDIGE